ncbi:MAG: GH92 family glycosyl hydrolase [Bacteroidales bacterium]|nr:GH92 family glycosyl hydrolase [Bacteroidales bacterium]
MRHFLAPVLAALIALAGCAQKYSDYVNPNIGTVHSRWFVYTPAAVPFGMAKLGPSTNGTYGNASGWEAVGYEDTHGSIDGFPCFHEFQVGGLALMPVTGEPLTSPGVLEDPDGGWRSRFDKETETARPGYYSVVLKDYGVKTELTATERVGFLRFSFDGKAPAHILVNVGTREGESGAVRDARASLDGNVIQGYIVTEPEYVKKYQAGATVSMYFYGILSARPEGCSAFHVGGETVQGNSVSGPGAVLCLDYGSSRGLEIKIGLSYTSVENARKNLEAEAASLNFEGARRKAAKAWEDALGRIEVKGGSPESRIKFYTGLWHALLGRGLASDVNGAYPRNDGSVGYIKLDASGRPVHNHYNTDAIWGGYWNLTQLWALAYPEYYNDWVASQLLVFKDAGWLGDGIACSKYVSGVGTNMVPIAFAGAYNSGIRNYNLELMYKAARKDNLEWEGRIEGAGKMDVQQFVTRGYVPYVSDPGFVAHSGGATFSVSHTLEYGFSAYATAQLAKQLGYEEDYHRLMDLSDGWARLFDDELKLVRPRVSSGEFIEPFDPLESWRGFQEGNAVQYTFFVPQNPDSLITRLGKDVFNERLDGIFTEARKSIFGGGKVAYAFSGLNSPYNHGNQPCLHEPWLFNFSGRPDLSQKWVRLICDEFYGTDGEHGYGYGQDEDQGQLGAWYVMSTMGLFDVQGGAPSEPTFQLGSPAFDKITVHLSPMNARGKSFVIKTRGNGPEAYYVQGARFNGKPLDRNWLYRSQVFDGGVLELEMGVEPSSCWDGSVPPVSR